MSHSKIIDVIDPEVWVFKVVWEGPGSDLTPFPDDSEKLPLPNFRGDFCKIFRLVLVLDVRGSVPEELPDVGMVLVLHPWS